MPELSRFLGVVIAMYYRDHGPPHFHAVYGEFEITMEIETGEASGEFPKRALAHVRAWCTLHRNELREAWADARERRPMKRIKPLE